MRKFSSLLAPGSLANKRDEAARSQVLGYNFRLSFNNFKQVLLIS